MSVNMDEVLGREMRARLELHAQYVLLLNVLNEVISGQTDPRLIRIDLQTNSWGKLPAVAQFVPDEEPAEAA